MRNMPSAVASSVSRSAAQQTKDISKYEAAKKGVGSATLLCSTAISLLGEARLHFMHSQYKPAMRVALGQWQRTIGLAGIGFYGAKFAEDHEPRTAAMVLGYSLFNAEGFARMLEAQKRNLPITGITGMAAAGVKMSAAQTFLCATSYAADLLANTIESRHGAPKPVTRGFSNAMWQLSHSMDRHHIATIQIGAALGMFCNAIGKVFKYELIKPPIEESKLKEQQQAHELERINTICEAAFQKLENGDPEFATQFEQLCNARSEEEMTAIADKLVQMCS